MRGKAEKTRRHSLGAIGNGREGAGGVSGSLHVHERTIDKPSFLSAYQQLKIVFIGVPGQLGKLYAPHALRCLHTEIRVRRAGRRRENAHLSKTLKNSQLTPN